MILLSDATKYTERLVMCSEDCACHKGARYDQIECRCDWFCGEPASQELLTEIKNEKFTLIDKDNQEVQQA